MSKRKKVRPGVREIIPVSIYGEIYGGNALGKRCVLSLEMNPSFWVSMLASDHYHVHKVQCIQIKLPV